MSKTAPKRPQRPAAAPKLSARTGNLMANSNSTPNISVGNVGISPQYGVDNSLQKFAQLILFGIAMIGIWAGLISIAIDGDGDITQWALLGFGGLFSGIMAVSLVEFQRKKGGNDLQDVHDYMLGIGFFFLAIGSLYSARWLVETLINYEEFSWLLNPNWSANQYGDDGWVPGAKAIYFQLGALVALVCGQTIYLNKLKGKTTFAWSVTTFTPIVMACIGGFRWMEWSNDIVSYELGISMITLVSLSMWLSLRANSGIIFSVVAVTSGLVPLFYEINNVGGVDGRGGALSLLVFIIAVQGFMAADKRLRQDLMQWTSIFLVGEVILAMYLARDGVWEDMVLVLGPVKQAGLPTELQDYITLQVVLWFAVLIAYFPATLKRRIPYMPIGLAASLFIIEPDAGLIPWMVTLIMLPYLLVISKVTRNWVANWTIIATASSFFLQSYIGGFEPGWMEATILIGILTAGEFGRQKGHLSDWAHFVSLMLMVFSKSVLMGEDPYLPWTLVFYAMGNSYIMMLNAQKLGSNKSAFEASIATGCSMIFAVILSLADRLEVPLSFLPNNIQDTLSGFNITLASVGLIVYVSMRRFKTVELDIGAILSWADSNKGKILPVFDTEKNAWVIPEKNESSDLLANAWGPLGRMSLIGPLMLFTVALTAAENALADDIFWVLLMIIPIGIIILEVLSEEKASSAGRMIATVTLLLVAAPMAFALNNADSGDSIKTATILFDSLLLLGPLSVSLILAKKGLNEDTLDEAADTLTLCGLLVLGLFDTSGGLLFFTMYLLVFQRALKHRVMFVLCTAPLALMAIGSRYVSESALVGDFIKELNISVYDPIELTIYNIPRLSYLIMAITSLIILSKGVLDRRYGLKEGVAKMSMPIPSVWLTVGMFGVLPEASWILLSMTIILTLFAVLMGELGFVPWSLPLIVASFLVGFSLDSNFNSWGDGKILSYSLLGTGLYTLMLNQVSSNGWIYRYADDVVELGTRTVNGVERPKEVTIFNLETLEGREKLTSILRLWTIACLTLSWDAALGFGTIAGAIWITYDLFVNGQKWAILGLPLLHSFATWNTIDHHLDVTPMLSDLIVGSVMTVSGIFFTILASKTEMAWNWKFLKWDEESEYFDWIDRVGLLGIAYFLAGISWSFGFAEQDALIYTIFSAFLSGIAIQGFRDETDTVWRRAVGCFGTIISLFMLSTTFEDNLYQNITWMFIGVVALGFGFAYFNRMQEVSTLFDESSITEGEQSLPGFDKLSELGIPKPITNPKDVIEDDVIDIDEKESSEPDETKSKEVAKEKDIKDTLAEKKTKSIEETILKPVTKKSQTGKKAGKKDDSLLEKVAEKPIQKTDLKAEYDLLLDPAVSKAIQDSLASTPHEGFQPVVSIGANGNLKIDFVPL